MTVSPTPGPDATGSEPVYIWKGPPRLALWRGPVTLPSGLSYVGHALRTEHPGVVIIAIEETRILLVRSFRPAVGRELWELPRGFGVSADAPANALREIREETGLVGADAHVVGSYVTDSTLLPGEVHVVRLTIRTDQHPSVPDGEISDQKWVPLGDLPAMVANGLLADAHTLAALAIAGLATRDPGPHLPLA